MVKDVLLNENPTIKIELSAHTDSRGGNSYNQKLSEKRAQSCVNYLIENGITANRLEAKGYGETRLKDTGDNAAAHRANRRIQVKVTALVDVKK